MAKKNLAQLGAPYLPSLWKGKFRLFGIDITPNPRPYAFKLSERECVYQPTPIKGQLPITYGHAYSNINVLTERQSPHAPSWALPQSTRRVSRQDQEQQTITQFRSLLEDKQLPFHRELCIQATDSHYSTPSYLGAFVDLSNLISLTRSRGNRVYSFPAQPEAQIGKRGRPRLYGPKMDLKDPSSWPQPDETAIFSQNTYRGKPRIVEIQAWHNVLMRGHRKKACLPMHQYPFTLVRVRIYDARMRLLFPHDPLWLIVMGQQRHQLSPQDIYDIFGLRSGMEHFFRFTKQNLLLDSFQTPDTSHEENWWQLANLAYLQLWVAKEYASNLPRPWERHLPQVKEKHISPTMVQRSFGGIIEQIGTFSQAPKRRNNSRERLEDKVRALPLAHSIVLNRRI